MKILPAILLLASLATAGFLHAAVPKSVVVAHPGNEADSTGYGAVPYIYRIGKYEVTNAEYCEFLNGVAKSDRFGLYDGRMAGEYGGILRSGSAGDFRYHPKAGCGRKPVNYVTWESCARYANWLSNGRGGAETERGPYLAKGGSFASPDHAALAARGKIVWLIASEDEWYKAAYYDPSKGGNGGYWPFAAKGGGAPRCNLNTNVVTEAGAFSSSPSACGTFDQNGNLWEYLDSVTGNKVGLRGGSFFLNDHTAYLRSSTRYDVLSAKWPNYGFRVSAVGFARTASVPTPRPSTPTPPPVPPKPEPSPPPSRPDPPRRSARIFYVSQSEGNDDWSGLSAIPKGRTGPWKTLARASINCIPGDMILLRRGDTWNEELAPKGSGTPDKPVTIGAYDEGSRPVIDRRDDKQDLSGIRLSDQGGFRITGLEFKRCMTGIYAEYSDDCPTKEFIHIEDCYFHDSLHYQHYEDYPKRKIGLGICFFSFERDKRIVLKDITIADCVFRRLASGVWTNSPDNFNKNASFVYNFANMTMEGCLFEEGYQWQQGIRGVDGGVMRDCVTHDVGRNFLSFNGVAGSMFFRCKDWIFEDCEWGHVSIGLGSGDGQAFDFEGNCDNMTMRRCLFHDTDGPGFLLCCYASDGNPHKNIVMENCVINAKSKRPIGLPRCAIVNTTDWNEATWRNCRFYLSPGEALMKVMDPEKDKRSTFIDCLVKNLGDACSTTNLALAAGVSALSQQAGHAATSAKDGNPSTAWIAKSSRNEWLVLDFGAPATINEFRIREDRSSSINRYVIECWDDDHSRWVGCFHGMQIGPEFVAPIVERTTRRVRLRILDSGEGPPAIAEFEAYHDTTGGIPITAGGDPVRKN